MDAQELSATSPDGQYVATAQGQTVAVAASSGGMLWSANLQSLGEITGLSYSGDGKELVVTANGFSQSLEAATGSQLGPPSGDAAPANPPDESPASPTSQTPAPPADTPQLSATSPDGQYVATAQGQTVAVAASSDGMLWSANLQSLGEITGLSYSGDGKELVVTANGLSQSLEAATGSQLGPPSGDAAPANPPDESPASPTSQTPAPPADTPPQQSQALPGPDKPKEADLRDDDEGPSIQIGNMNLPVSTDDPGVPIVLPGGPSQSEQLGPEETTTTEEVPQAPPHDGPMIESPGETHFVAAPPQTTNHIPSPSHPAPPPNVEPPAIPAQVHEDALAFINRMINRAVVISDPHAFPQYQPGYGGNPSHCSEYARDLIQTSLGRHVPELDGLANNQAQNLATAAKNPFGTGWRSITPPYNLNFDRNRWQIALNWAKYYADHGMIVVITFLNTDPSPGHSGHIAVVSPSRPMHSAPHWDGINVPDVSQAGVRQTIPNGPNLVSPHVGLNWAFTKDKAPWMGIYVYDPSGGGFMNTALGGIEF